MGYRLYYATTYKVKYEGGYFNHKTGINRFLADKCNAAYNDEVPEYSDQLEVERAELVKLVQDIKDNPKEYEYYVTVKGWDYTPEDLIKIFIEFIEKSDPQNDFIVLEWF